MSQAPMYRVIQDDITTQIRDGVLRPKDRLPSEHELARMYGVSRMTVRQALDLLDADQLVMRRQGAGTFVSARGFQGRQLNRLRSFADELGGDTGAVTSRVVGCSADPLPPEVADAFELLPDDLASHLVRVRVVDGAPAALQDTWVPYAVAPSLTREPLLSGSLYRTLTEGHGVRLSHADQSMLAAELSAAQAELLDVEPGTPALRSRRTTFDLGERMVEYTTSWTLSDFPILLRVEAE